MTCTDWIRSIELTSGMHTITEIDRWSWTDFSTLDPVPRTVRYRHHPRVGPSNPQQPVTRCHRLFTGHRFRVGRSKK